MVASRDTDRYIGLQAGELVCLGGDDGDYISLLALDAELTDSGGQISLLIRGHCRTDNKGAQTAKSQEQLCQCLVLEDKLQRSSIDENAILLVLIKEVHKTILIAHIDRLAAGGYACATTCLVAFLEFRSVAPKSTHVRRGKVTIGYLLGLNHSFLNELF